MYLPPITGNLTAAEAEVLAEWHEEKAASMDSPKAKLRHEVIAFRLWKAANGHRTADRHTQAAA